jgi:hypothetical protein
MEKPTLFAKKDYGVSINSLMGQSGFSRRKTFQMMDTPYLSLYKISLNCGVQHGQSLVRTNQTKAKYHLFILRVVSFKGLAGRMGKKCIAIGLLLLTEVIRCPFQQPLGYFSGLIST